MGEVLIEALHHAPPVGQKRDYLVENVGRRALLIDLHGFLLLVMSFFVVADDDHGVLQRTRH